MFVSDIKDFPEFTENRIWTVLEFSLSEEHFLGVSIDYIFKLFDQKEI